MVLNIYQSPMPLALMFGLGVFTLKGHGSHSVPVILAGRSTLTLLLIYSHCFIRLIISFVCFVCFVALRPKSTAMVIAGRSVHLTTLFPGQA